MSTEVAIHQPNELAQEMQYAQAICMQPERGATSLLPKAYQGNPANVLIAIGLGKAIGITPAQALYEIYVVNGRPSPSANLMAALVRRAGHRLRVEGNTETCTATLVRHDDPDFPFIATWTMAQARAAGLASKDTWKAYPGAMLRARAISEVVRMGAPEAVIGMDYSAEEMADIAPAPAAAPRVTAADFTKPAEVAPAPQPEPDPSRGLTEAVQATATAMTPRTRGQLFALFNELGISEDEQRAGIAHVLGRPIESRGAITDDEARRVIERLKVRKAEVEAGAQPVEPGVFKAEQ